jgi:hypothetical protein
VNQQRVMEFLHRLESDRPVRSVGALVAQHHSI